MIRLGALYGLVLGAVFVAASVLLGSCYDTTVKTPPCSVNPAPEGCYPFPHDRRADGGAR